jgi:hypothetical protein
MLLMVGCGCLLGCHSHGANPSAPGPANRAPTARITFSGSNTCPAPCSVALLAIASDPNTDPLTYTWGGCAVADTNWGTAHCRVASAGTFTATLTVSDGHGGTATDSATVTGVAATPTPTPPPPTVDFLGAGWASPAAPPYIGYFGVDANASDGAGSPVCDCVGAEAQGVCVISHVACRCMLGIWLDVYTTAPTGSCTLTLTVRDRWGQLGSGSLTVNVEDVPAAPSLQTGRR